MNTKATEWTEFPLSDNERLKGESNYLHGTIAEDLNEQLTGGFSHDNFQLIRFHGMYEQDNRDIRAERKAQKLDTNKNVMLRCRLPGGIITPKQWLGIDEFATKHTSFGSIRLTNRQTFQFHGVLKKDIKPMHQWLHQLGLDAIATAGDVNRNVLCTPNPVESALHRDAYEWAKKISEHLLPRTTAYADIWLDGEKVLTTEQEKPFLKESSDTTEPILGKTYLPRKFKTSVVIPPLNDVDLHANDLNFVAIAEEGKLIGFNILIGGGLSMDFTNHHTYPSTAQALGFVMLRDVLPCAEAVVTIQRDWGNRSDRKNAKLRYTLERVGLEVFRQEVERRAAITLEKVRSYQFTERGDRIGWVEGEDKKWHLTLFIENGRLIDTPERPIKSGIREIAKIHKGDFRLTANQNLIVANVAQEDKIQIEEIAKKYKLIDETITPLRQQSMACVALPTCPLAMAEAERFLPSFVDKIDALMSQYGVSQEQIVLRVTGCPNGCGRAMLAEIGLVGRALGRYNLYIGGNREGTRIPRLFKENITEEEIITIIEGWISDWSCQRLPQEGIGDFAIRTGIVQAVTQPAIDFWEKQS